LYAKKTIEKMYEDKAEMTWQEKAEKLRSDGYHLIIQETGGGMSAESEDEAHWTASIGGEGSRDRKTIEEAVSAVYDEVHEQSQIKEVTFWNYALSQEKIDQEYEKFLRGERQ